MDRRLFLKSGLATALLPADGACAAVSAGDTLQAHAARKGLVFGSAMATWQIATRPDLTALLKRQVGMVVPEYEAKRAALQPERNRYDFGALDRLVAFAARQHKQVRGHTLCWYAANPGWLESDLGSWFTSAATKKELLTGYIRRVMTRYKGRIRHWDVVNEPTDPRQGRADGMRARNPWSQALGEGYIDIAFHAARAADPSALLFMNEYGIEADTPENEAKRTAVLKLLDRMKRRGVPIDGFGIQAHMRPYQDRFSQIVLADFIAKLRGYGLRVAITELDFNDRGGPTAIVRRDHDVAMITRALLDTALQNPTTDTVLTWGLTDRFSWLSSHLAPNPWPAGQFDRGLPFDADLKPKPMYQAIIDAFDAAAPRAKALRR